MFNPLPGNLKMIDPERSFSFRSLGTTDHGGTILAALTMNGREFPYEYWRDQAGESDPWYEITLGSVGASPTACIQHGVEAAQFENESEYSEAVIAVIEATLAYETIGYAQNRGDGYNRLSHGGVEYQLSDFGPYFETSGGAK